MLNNIYFLLGKPTIAGEYWTSFAWDNDIPWLKVSDSRIESFLKWLKEYTVQSQMCTRLYLHPI